MVHLATRTSGRSPQSPHKTESATVVLGRGLINGQPNVGVDAPPNVRFRAHKRHQAQAKLSAMHVLTLSISSLFNMESDDGERYCDCLLYTSPSPRDGLLSRMPS